VLLVLVLAVVDAAGGAILLDLNVDLNGGAYSVLVNNKSWLNSGPYAFHFNDQWYSSSDGSLSLVASAVKSGEDILGVYKETALTWLADSNFVIVTTFKSYFPEPILIFSQYFLQELQNTSVGSNTEVVSSFPTFKIEPSNFHYYSYYNTFATPQIGKWGPGTSYTGGAQGGVPLVLFDPSLSTLVISPLDNFMVGIQTISPHLNQFSCGLQGKIASIPASFSHSTIITASTGVANAHHYWGGLLTKFYGKNPKKRQ